ncbi:MAG: GHKL domain-containing protein [Lachnospiraceae bacterium]|nr:GHKL domain-containing protein [Lachnospiraceae bacterium]
MAFFVGFFLLSALIVGIVFSYIERENRKVKRYLEIDEILLKTQREFYEALLSKENDTRRFRHDIRNHLICLAELAKQGHTKKIEQYIEEMSERLQVIDKKIYCVGNTVVDAIINYYIGLLDDEVDVEIRGMCNCNLGISETDLCTVISNLVQNAMEELNRKQSENPFLRIVFTSGERYLKIEISNSTADNKERLLHNFVTSKTDKRNHGLGLRNVKEALEKNHGKLETDVGRNVFKAKVILPLEKSVQPLTEL